jgi:hypothetical protein
MIEESSKPRTPWRVGIWVFLFCFSLLFLLDENDHFLPSDTRQVYDDSLLLASGRKPVSRYAPGQAILFLPIAFAEKTLLSDLDPSVRGFVLERATGAMSPFFAAATALVLVAFFARLGFSPRAAGWMSVLGVVSTAAMPYGTQGFTEIIQTFAILCSFYFLLVFLDDDSLAAVALAGTFAGLAFLFKSVLLLLIPILAAAVFFRHGVSRRGVRRPGRSFAALAAFGVPAVCVASLYFLYNHMRSGHWFAFGYTLGWDERIGFRGSLLAGLWGQLLSPGKSLLPYSPVLFFVFYGWGEFRKRQRTLAAASLAAFAVVTMVYAKWWSWSGNWAWGSRYITPFVPLLFVPAALGLRRVWRGGPFAKLAVLAVCAVSIFIQVAASWVAFGSFMSLNPASVMSQRRAGNWTIDDHLVENFHPDASPIVNLPWFFARGIEAAPFIRAGTFGHFGVKWKGDLLVPNSPRRELATAVCGRAIVWIDNKTVVDKDWCEEEEITTVSLAQVEPGWRPIKIWFQARGAPNPAMVLGLPAVLRTGSKGEPGLKGRYFAFTGDATQRRRLFRRVDPRIDFQWKNATPFNQRLMSGCPAAKIFVPGDLVYRALADHHFTLRPWPMRFYYTKHAEPAVWFSATFFTALGVLLLSLAMLAIPRFPVRR